MNAFNDDIGQWITFPDDDSGQPITDGRCDLPLLTNSLIPVVMSCFIDITGPLDLVL